VMATRPYDPYPTPQAVMTALLGFVQSGSHEKILLPSSSGSPHQTPPLGVGGREAEHAHRVLVVDDSPTSRRFCVYTLGEEGLHCDEAEDGRQALRAVAEHPYDLVITDWLMPGMTGLELCRELRENPPSPHLKIIVYSARVAD